MKELKNILLIDDNIHDNYIHTFVIRNYDPSIEVQSVTSGEDAIEYFKKSRQKEENHPYPDLVFLDINMPGMNGFEFLEKAREIDLFDHLTTRIVIMLTSSLNPADVHKAKDSFDNEIIEFKNKPLTVEMLKAIIDELE